MRPPKVEFLLYVKQFLKDISGMVTQREKLKSLDSNNFSILSPDEIQNLQFWPFLGESLAKNERTHLDLL